MSKVHVVQCPSCGFPIGKIAPIFRKMRYEKTKEATYNNQKINIDNPMIISSYDENYNIIDIFEKLNVRNMCCKVRLNTEILPQEIIIE